MVSTEVANSIQYVLGEIRAKLPQDIARGFEFAISSCYVKPASVPDTLPATGPGTPSSAAAAAASAAEAAAAEEADARSTATGVAGKRSGKSDADPY